MSACQWCKSEVADRHQWRSGEVVALCRACSMLWAEAEVLRIVGAEPHEFADLARRTREHLGKPPGPVVKSPADIEFERAVIRNGWGKTLREIEEEFARHVKNDADRH